MKITIQENFSPGEYVIFWEDYEQAFKGDVGMILEKTPDNGYVVWNKRSQTLIHAVQGNILIKAYK